MKTKWFWISFGLWMFLGSLFSAWALIYSPFRLQWRPGARFDADLNGFRETNSLDTVSGPLEESLRETRAQWESEGWTCKDGGANLLPFLLHADDRHLLSTFAYVTMFQKGGLYRTLCFYNDSRLHRTYRLVCEMPRAAFDPSSVRAHWSFPLPPPPEALSPYCGGYKGFQVATWSLPQTFDPAGRFRAYCSLQGFDASPWEGGGGREVFVLRKGSVRLTAFLETRGGKDVVSIVRSGG